jgi:hypothetical protein
MEPRARAAHGENGDEGGMSGRVECPAAKWRPADSGAARDGGRDQRPTELDQPARRRAEGRTTDDRPVRVIAPMGFWRDEGTHAARFVGGPISRPGRLRKLARFTRMLRAMPYLGYVVVGGARV